jgi:2-oxoacid:acceptor oxidoreductase delta subunit (pyruvate/2-ketoisovalerate family)
MSDLPFAITLRTGSSLANHTGSWRVERPVYVDRMPPCNDACPAGENIQQWLYRAEEGSYEAAWRQIMRDNPLPAVMGRACFHPCQTACNRGRVDEAVGINAIERFLGDRAIAESWAPPAPRAATGKRVLVVGSGPAGLAAAYHLRLYGHDVVIREASPEPGGMMRYGIPTYRLPRQVVGAEIERIQGLGVEIECGHSVEDAAAAMSEGRFDALFVAVGAQRSKHVDIPAGDTARIIDALSLLRHVRDSADEQEPPRIGRRVVVYGGGDTAMDAARTVRRLGASDALVVYRRTRDRMPADQQQVHDAEDEGVRLKWLSTIVGDDGETLKVEHMVLGDDGFPQPTGEVEELQADVLVLAVGEVADLSLLRNFTGVAVEDEVVAVGPDMMTGRPGVFAGGDIVAGARTLTEAVGHGKRAARGIDAWLAGRARQPSERHALARPEFLNTWYYADAPHAERPRLEAARRASSFSEVVAGLDEDNALFEARRCLSCGNCFQCDNCFGVCPDNAVRKVDEGHGYAFDYDFCKGCGLCVQECPCGAIEMVPEEI